MTSPNDQPRSSSKGGDTLGPPRGSAAITIEVTIGAPMATVWQSLRDPELIKRWHGWHADELDEEISLIFGNPQSVDEDSASASVISFSLADLAAELLLSSWEKYARR